MKFVFLLVTSLAFSQIRFIDKQYTTLGIGVDFKASFKEKGVDAIFELEHISYWKYVKASVQVFPALKGGYIDATGGFGINLSSDKFDTFRYYTGGRLGLINRGGSIYPLVGFEGGIDYNINNNLSLGVRGTGDWREDMLFSGADPKMIYSTYLRVNFRL